MKQTIKRVLPAGAVRFARSMVADLTRPAKLRRARVTGSRLKHYAPGRRTVLFFVPEGGVRLYLAEQAVLGRTLLDLGHNVLFVRCFDVFPRCPYKDSVLMPFDVARSAELDACLHCHDQTLSMLDEYDLDYLDVRELLGATVLAGIRNTMAGLPEDRGTFEHGGIRIGQLALYDFSIINKHSAELDIGPAERARIDQYIENSLLAIEVVRAAHARHRLDAVACFDEYSMMSAARLAARDLGLQARMVSVAYHFNADPSRVVAMSSPTIVREQELRAGKWPQWRDLPLPRPMVETIFSDLIHRLSRSGAHIYSPNKTADAAALMQTLRLAPGRRLLVAYPSSRDEHDALVHNLRGLGVTKAPAREAFADQFEWLSGLIDWVESGQDYQLVIRIHPRVGATPRDGRASPDLARYRERFSGDYRHCRIVWPADKVSSYDLAELADAALISWSTMGLELARLGVPVMSGHTSLLTAAPPGETFIRLAGDRTGYFNAIAELVAVTPDAGAAALRAALRWYNLFYLGNAIDISDLGIEEGRLPVYRRPANAELIESVMLGRGEALDANLARLCAHARSVPDPAIVETDALRGQIGRLIAFIATGRDPGQDVGIAFGRDPAAGGAAMTIAGQNIVYTDDNIRVNRFSPLLVRLGNILQSMQV